MNEDIGFGFLMGALLAVVVMGIALCFSQSSWEQDAIAHGYAEHDAKTGKWHWIELTKTKGE